MKASMHSFHGVKEATMGVVTSSSPISGDYDTLNITVVNSDGSLIDVAIFFDGKATIRHRDAPIKFADKRTRVLAKAPSTWLPKTGEPWLPR